ncbi:MAG: NAD(P)H-dependent oxidoreductase [Candidatus Omnitrophica bacterium]|nr:NAD(P)H-dependent oxidoreductase [Candidatus Omnitrophota bacterium]
MKVIALGGSVRGSVQNKDFLCHAIRESENLDTYLGKIKTHIESGLPDSQLLSNSEILAGVALMGAKNQGCDVEFYPLLQLFERREHKVENLNLNDFGLDNDINLRDLLKVDAESLKIFINKIKESDGIVFVSPVYFGDRSSVANKFIQLASKYDLIKGKVVGACSVGTKRNGGQETTNIFFLYEALNLGAMVVGNGPESCQYGGTAWAGDKGKVLKDAFGIETSYGTGERITQVCRIASNMSSIPKPSPDSPTTITILVTMDTPERKLRKFIQEYLDVTGADAKQFKFKLIELIDGDIERCFACNICPIPQFIKNKPESTNKDPYACIIRRSEDSLSSLRDELINSDGILLAGLNLKNMNDVIYRYQAFMERTRFIRRNDFELTNIPMTGLLLNEVGAFINPIHNLKVMTSFMRHNGIMLKPVTAYAHNGKMLESNSSDFISFIRYAQKIKEARKISDPIEVSYKALGYGDKRLDNTAALRK